MENLIVIYKLTYKKMKSYNKPEKVRKTCWVKKIFNTNYKHSNLNT